MPRLKTISCQGRTWEAVESQVRPQRKWVEDRKWVEEDEQTVLCTVQFPVSWPEAISRRGFGVLAWISPEHSPNSDGLLWQHPPPFCSSWRFVGLCKRIACTCRLVLMKLSSKLS